VLFQTLVRSDCFTESDPFFREKQENYTIEKLRNWVEGQLRAVIVVFIS
jgi:hypothetical protein